MDSDRPILSGRLIRALAAAGILVGGFLIADAVLTDQPASAAAEIDLLPIGESPVSDLVDTVISVAPVAAPLIESASPILDPVASAVDATLAPLAPVTTPILTPVRDATQPIVDTVVTPILDGATTVLTPVVTPVVEVIVPVAQIVAEGATAVAWMTASSGILSGATGPAVSIALLGALVVGAASVVPIAPVAPAGRAPGGPEGASATATSLLSEVFWWIPAAHGALAPASGAPARPHASPVFASDTTPD